MTEPHPTWNGYDQPTTKNYTRDEGDTHRYRAEIPNIVDDMHLSVYAFRLYAHLKRVAGDTGMCWQSTETIAAACEMSTGSVSDGKVELATAGLIAIEVQGAVHYHNITIIDIWKKNLAAYHPKASPSPGETAPSPGETAPSPGETAPSPGETKNNPIKKDPTEEPQIEAAPQSPAPRKRKPLCAANQAHWETTKRRLNDKQLAAIEGVVTDLKLWQRCLDDWLMRGYNPGNVDGLLKAYGEGGLKPLGENRYAGNQGRGTRPTSYADRDEF